MCGYRKQERTFELSEVVQRRKELEQHAEERAKDEAFKARVAARDKAHAARRQDVAEKRELLLQHNMKQVLPLRCSPSFGLDVLWLSYHCMNALYDAHQATSYISYIVGMLPCSS